MWERIKDWKTTSAGIINLVVCVGGLIGINMDTATQVLTGVLGAIGTVLGLFSKD